MIVQNLFVRSRPFLRLNKRVKSTNNFELIKRDLLPRKIIFLSAPLAGLREPDSVAAYK